MKRLILSVIPAFLLLSGFGQSEDPAVMQETAKKFMQQGDFANATIILVRANEQAPFSLSVAKDLAICYYMQNEDAKGLKVIQKHLDNENADEQTYQIAGMIYKKLNQIKEADRVYKKALKLFPSSGPLYNDYGDLLWSQQDYAAITQWEKGIKEEPDFPGNYYNAAKYYYFSVDKIWSLIYGEIFLNIESYSPRAAEIKTILLEGYKKLYANSDLLSDTKDKNKFEVAFLTCMNQQNDLVVRGITAETLTMIRTRFILSWFAKNAAEFPFKLFETQKYMLENGLFDAYNQWIFGASQSLSAFQNWTKTNVAEYGEFNTYLLNRSFKIPKNQYYH